MLGKKVMYHCPAAEGGYAASTIVDVVETSRRFHLVKLENGRWFEARKLFFVEKHHRLEASASATA